MNPVTTIASSPAYRSRNEQVAVRGLTPRSGMADAYTASRSATPSQSSAVTVTLGAEPSAVLTYPDPRSRIAAERPDLAAMLAESERKVEAFMAFLEPLLAQQGLSISKLVTGEQKLTLDQGTIDQAKSAIAEDGPLGVRAVAERILNFAKIGIGSDSAQIETFRAAVQKGFDDARRILGGVLPEISQRTYDSIMNEMDRWHAEGIPPGAVSLAPAGETRKDA